MPAVYDINKKGHFLQKKGHLKFQKLLFKPFLKSFTTRIFFLIFAKLKILTQMPCHKIVHILFHCKCNYVVLMVLQSSVQGGTRTASSV